MAIVVRRGLLFVGEIIPLGWNNSHWCLDTFIFYVLDHNVILALTTVFPTQGLLPLLVDGPRSGLGYYFVSLKDGEEEELFGSRAPGVMEKVLWRSRYLIYIALRGWVTNCW